METYMEEEIAEEEIIEEEIFEETELQQPQRDFHSAVTQNLNELSKRKMLNIEDNKLNDTTNQEEMSQPLSQTEQVKCKTRKIAEAEKILRNKTKEIAASKALEKFRYAENFDKIESLKSKRYEVQKKMDIAKIENNELQKQAELDTQEINILKNKVKESDEMVNGLKSFVSNLDNKLKEILPLKEDIRIDVLKVRANSLKTAQSKISEMAEEYSKLNVEESSSEDLANLKIYVNNLASDCNNLEENVNIIRKNFEWENESNHSQKAETKDLDKKIEEFVNNIDTTQKCLNDFYSSQKQSNSMYNESITNLNARKEAGMNNHKRLQMEDLELKNQIELLNVSLNKNKSDCLTLENESIELIAKTSAIKNDLNKAEDEFLHFEGECNEKLKVSIGEIRKLEEEIINVLDEDNRLKTDLVNLKNEYFNNVEEKMKISAEKSSLISLKEHVENKLSNAKILNEKLKIATNEDESNLAMYLTKIEDFTKSVLEEEQQHILENNKLDEELYELKTKHVSQLLETEKGIEYAKASTNYWDNRLVLAQKELEESQSQINQIKSELVRQECTSDMMTKQFSKFTDYLNKIKPEVEASNVTDMPAPLPPLGILKSPGKFVSPKKVKFQGVSSSDNSSQSSEQKAKALDWLSEWKEEQKIDTGESNSKKRKES